MKRSPATLRDVAEAAGVHTSTVSRALNPATREIVNDTTAARVIDAAQRLGYEPHPLARGLRTNRTMTVGVVIPDVENPLFGPIIAGVESELGAGGYSLLIANTQPEQEEEEAAIETLLGRRVDGLIVATATDQDSVVASLAHGSLPTVMVNRHDNAGSFPAIVGDDRRGIGLAVSHLRELGHAGIAHIAGPDHLSTGAARAEAFAEAMRTAGLPVVVERAEWFGLEPGERACQRLLDGRRGITAIVAANDLLALGCYRTARRRGLEVGKQLSITGYNDMPLADLMQPSLTTVRVPYREMGAAAAQVLLGWMRSDDPPDRSPALLTPELRVRDSTARPAH